MKPTEIKPTYFVNALREAPQWAQTRLKFPASLITSGSRDWSEYFSDEGTPFVRITNLSRGKLAIKYTDLQSVVVPEGVEGGRAKLCVGDLLLSITAYLGSVGLADEGIQGGHVSQHIALVRIGDAGVDPKWIGYSLLSSLGQEQLTGEAYGGTKVQLSLEDVRNLWFAHPPLAEQHRIGAYLDAETAQMDALVAEKEQMLKLLEEKRAAQISHAVSRGLNPRAPLKPSALPWLGDIPKHWDLKRSKWLLRERDQRSETGEEEMLTVSHLTGVTPRSEKDVNMFEAETNEGYKLVSADQLVINTLWAWMGAMGIARHEGIVSPAYHVYRIMPELLPEYVDYLVRTEAFKAEVIRYSKGVWSSRLRLYPEGLHEVWLPVPPLEEQRAIVAHLTSERERTAGLEAALRDSIQLIQERRRALITAAVTGQIAI